VDVDGHDVVPGSSGEAWTRGPATTSGYWGDPELTAATLTADGWYRTGDLVDIDPDGYVRVLGRLTDLIIRGGANVSPAEVEAVLTGHPDVREATVVGLPDPEYGERVVAAVVLEPGVVLDTPSLRQHCVLSLAGYKVPTCFVAMSELPRNASTGKVHRREVARALSTPGTQEEGATA
jgi:acyl-CoA synthetase (AMP-forming)/AMP-acid ligase II